MNVKKLSANMVILVLAISLVVGCATSESGSSSNASPVLQAGGGSGTVGGFDDGGTEYMTGKGVYPIVREGHDITLTVFVPTDPRLTDPSYGMNTFTTQWVDETGVKLKFMTVPESDAATKLNVLINSNDYPDMIQGASTAQMVAWAGQGILLQLDKYIEQYTVDMADFLNGDPVAKTIISDINGDIYATPYVSMCRHCFLDFGRVFYYAPFQQELGLEVPTTLDKFADNLRAIRDNDANSNGDPNDEIPLAITSQNVQGLRALFANSFMPMASDTLGLTKVDGEIVMQYLNPKFKDSIEYVKMLWDES